MEYEAWKATWKAPLNPQQEAAVQAAQGPVLLLAVPGSGKTTVLIHRLGYLIFCLGVSPEQILTVTYTVAATRDMAARFARTFGETWANRLEFRTINGLSARIIQHYERVKGRQAFTLVTEEGRLASLVGELYRKATGEFATESTVRSLRTAITYCKNRQMTQEEIEEYKAEHGGTEPEGQLRTTKAQRTGCSMCGFGIHIEKRPNRFDQLRHRNPREWEMWMKHICQDETGEWYGWGRVLDYIGIGWEDDLFDREDQKPLCEECVERLKKDFTLEGPEEAPHKGTCWACRRKRKVVNRFAVEEVQG